MNKQSASLALVTVFLMAGFIHAQDAAPDEAEMMKKWQAFATPGPAHETLEYKVGQWKFTNKMWMAPDAPPSESEGSANYQMILGGRYLADHTNGTFNGMPFEGRGLTGFDNLKQEYNTLWIDNFGTGFMIGSGTYDADQKQWEFKAETTDPMTGGVAKFRSVEKIVDENHWVMTMYANTPDGNEFKSMEIKYERMP